MHIIRRFTLCKHIDTIKTAVAVGFESCPLHYCGEFTPKSNTLALQDGLTRIIAICDSNCKYDFEIEFTDTKDTRLVVNIK